MIIVPIMLVAANSIPRRITDVRTVPNIPVIRTGRMLHTQPRMPAPRIAGAAKSVTARYTTATPSNAHKKVGVTVITAVKLSIAVIIPIIILAAIARPVQSLLQLHVKLAICCSPPITIYAKVCKEVKQLRGKFLQRNLLLHFKTKNDIIILN